MGSIDHLPCDLTHDLETLHTLHFSLPSDILTTILTTMELGLANAHFIPRLFSM